MANKKNKELYTHSVSCNGVTITMTHGVQYQVSVLDKEIADLHKKATAQKKENKIDLAIETLKKANEKMQKSTTEYPVESWLRLPKYLQKAGRFQESLIFFGYVIKQLEVEHRARVARDIKGDRYFKSIIFLKHNELIHVFKSLSKYYEAIGDTSKSTKAMRICSVLSVRAKAGMAAHDIAMKDWYSNARHLRWKRKG
jgi:tetratricopeptide (TPR) repeat protein